MTDYESMDTDPRDDNDPANYEFLGRFDLDNEGRFYADIFENPEAPDVEDITPNLDAVFDLLGFQINDQDSILDLVTQSAVNIEDEFGFDKNSDDTRGGYSRDEVIEFLNETGWWGISDVYYDEELDEYYIDINYEETT